MSSWVIFENSLENICMLAFGYEVCTKSVEIERYKKTDNRWSRTFYVDMWKLKLSYMIHLFSSYHVLIGCDIRFIELSMLGPNWKIFHMNRLLYCYDLSPDWPENIWKIKRIEIFYKRIWFEGRYNGDTQWKSEVETKILVLHFLHTGGADGGSTNLIFCAQQQRRWYLTWKTTTTTTTTATTTTATTTTKSL